MVESRPGHRHHHLLIPGLQKKFVFYDPIHTEEKDGKVQRLHLGEVLGPGGHAVLPGSTHPSGSVYHLVEGCPKEMAEITLNQLKEILRGLEFSPDPDKSPSFEEAAGIKTARERLERAADDLRKKGRKATSISTLSEQLDVQRVMDAYGWTPKRTEGEEAKGEPPGHSSESGDCFQINLKTGQWHCKQCEAGGDLASLVAVMAGILSCTGHEDLRNAEVFSKVLLECERKGLIPSAAGGKGREKTTPPEDIDQLITEVKEAVLADPSKLQDQEIMRKLGAISSSPVAFELLLDDLKLKADMKKAVRKEAGEKAKEAAPSGGCEAKQPSALATVVEIVRGELEDDPEARFCYDQVGQPFLYLEAGDHHLPMALDSREFGIWTAKRGMERYNLPLARKTIHEADLSIMARGEEIMARKGLDLRVHMAPRMNMIDGSLWYDLGAEDMMGVEVTPQETAIRPLPLGLVRHPTDLPQTRPDLDADPLEIWKLMDFMPGVQKVDFLFLFAWIAGGFIPYWEQDGGPRVHLPHPLGGFIGPKGSSKTVTGRFVLKLLDPDAQESQSMPDTPRDMGIVLHNNRAVLFDNVTRVQEWQSNALCGGSTGGSNSNRKLRTDSEVVVHDYNARTMFTSVIKPEFESDAADRILCFYTRAIPPHMKKPEALLFQEFEKVKPRVMGAIFRTIQKAMEIYPTVLEESKTWKNQVRMADFCVLGECCARIWGFEPGILRDAYSQALAGDSGQMVMEDNVVLTLRNWIWTTLVLKEGGHWEGLVSDLKKKLEEDLRFLPQDWPSKPNRFSNRLRKAQEDLARAGISIDFNVNKYGTNVVIDAIGSSPLEVGGDTKLITTSITTRITDISKAIGGDGGDSCDKYTDKKRNDTHHHTPPGTGEGGDPPEGRSKNSGRTEILTPESITTTTTITTTESTDGGLGGGDGVVIPSRAGGGDHHLDEARSIIESIKAQDLPITRTTIAAELEKRVGREPPSNIIDKAAKLIEEAGEVVEDDTPKAGKIDRPTPEPEKARAPTPEEGVILQETAGRLVKNYLEISAPQISKTIHDMKGLFIPIRTAERWLESNGWTKTGTRANGGETWTPPEVVT